MRKPHFYKAYCRLGVHNIPHGQKSQAKGVETAPDFIIAKEFLDKFTEYKVSEFKFSTVQKLDSKKHYKTIADDTLNFLRLLKKDRHSSDTQVVIGGDHSVTFASALADIDRFGTNIGLIHFDSHGDFNLYKESPSKNFHGMYLRVLMDNFDLKRFDKMVPSKMSPQNFLFIGDLELDPGEIKFAKEKNLKTISHQDFDEDPKESLDEIRKFVAKFKHIHISFDIDVFNARLAPATTTPSQAGFSKEPIFEILQILKQAQSLSLDLAEVNVGKKGDEQTIKLAQEVILQILT